MADTIHSKLIEKIFTISRRMREEMTFTTHAAHLSLVQLQTLLYVNDHKKLQMRQIAEHFSIEMPTATSLLNRLVELNLVSRQADTKDRRVVRVALTKKGEETLIQAMEQRSKKIEFMLSYLTEGDKEEFLRILTSISSRMEEAEEK